MVYADYVYYRGTYCGMMPEDDFDRTVARASAYMDYYTQNRVRRCADLDAVKMCCCALADKYAVIDAAQALAMRRIKDAAATGEEVKSETVGGYSRTLATGADGAITALNTGESAKALLADTCREYLTNTGLLYRGGGSGCMLPTL